MLSIILCDNNLKTLQSLEKSLDKIFIKHNIDGTVLLTATTPKEVLDFSTRNQANVFILDINLNNNKMNGIELATKIRENDKNAYIIFVTGHFEYILSAYKIKTFDYLIKPFSTEKLEETILRLVDDMQMTSKKYLNLNNNIIIDKDKINYIKRDGMKLIFSTKDKEYETYSSFSKISPFLSKNFIRCHKSFIVNINNIEDIELNKNVISFSNQEECYIGPKYKNNFMEAFNNEKLKRAM